MKELWTTQSTGTLNAAKLVEYSDEEAERIIKEAKKYVICYRYSVEKDNRDDERGSGSYGGTNYYWISESNVLVYRGNAIGVLFNLKNENYGRFSARYTTGKHCIRFGDNKILSFNSSYYIGSTDVSEKNDISLTETSCINAANVLDGTPRFSGLQHY